MAGFLYSTRLDNFVLPPPPPPSPFPTVCVREVVVVPGLGTAKLCCTSLHIPHALAPWCGAGPNIPPTRASSAPVSCGRLEGVRAPRGGAGCVSARPSPLPLHCPHPWVQVFLFMPTVTRLGLKATFVCVGAGLLCTGGRLVCAPPPSPPRAPLILPFPLPPLSVGVWDRPHPSPPCVCWGRMHHPLPIPSPPPLPPVPLPCSI